LIDEPKVGETQRERKPVLRGNGFLEVVVFVCTYLYVSLLLNQKLIFAFVTHARAVD
jgi:hypothetical protein